MEYRKDVWFSPEKILKAYHKKEVEIGPEIKTNSKYKVIREARAVALLLFGIRKLQNREYWLQLVDPKEGSPDIRTATHLVEVDNKLYVEDVEVVTLETHSSEDIDDFLKRTKLSATKSYDEKTTILCNIERDLQTKPWSAITKSLASSAAKNDVFVLGRTDPKKWIYQLVRIHPALDHAIKFDVEEEIRKVARHTMRFERGTKRQERHEEQNYEPF